ncbi:HPr family phosphocarrier protein [Pseudoflavonifractor phocaeensis]|uniref:HPr family phosphocarrier protein n=1 Tax=Pseudoflavonifractor phocaeensis TaxID=1870988 RepID=UPI001957B0B4|nr:HPr family phosphocarrier protein [Pseudoflavonifractor phocaeensis]MBM6871375.1 HPr family phosphocarrier protein [Pseudoflavonifractor phocaeensis]MBM6937903.1 HPr family phosphocarrier protein [Pseudoflavonifractor phocaeensis]
MVSRKIFLNTVEEVKAFVDIITPCPYEIDLISGRFLVDAKSMLGIFSLDISKPVRMDIHTDSCDALLEQLKPYLVEE